MNKTRRTNLKRIHITHFCLLSFSLSSVCFYDFTILEKQHTKQKKDASKEPVLISKVTWMNFGQALIEIDEKEVMEEHPNEVWLRRTYEKSEKWSRVSLLKGRRKTPPNVDVPFPHMYLEGHPMNPKIDDLQRMIPFMSMEHHQFYTNLLSHPSSAEADIEYDD